MPTDRDLARWRLHSQHLAAPLDAAERVVGSLTAVQAENPSQSAWAVATRTASPRQDDFAEALATGRVLRLHVLRPTWHYVLADDAAWLLDLTAPRVLPVIAQQLRSIEHRTTALTDAVLAVLGEAPNRTRGELADSLAERDLSVSGQELMLLLAHLEFQRLVASGAPRDGEHSYARFDDRVPAPRILDRDAALAELAARYFTSHGPATDRDLAYWATLTVTDVRRGIAAAGDALASFDHDGRTFWHAPGEPPALAEPPGHLLQVLDEMYRGYQDSRWVLDADGVVPRARETAIGMALVDGQLVAGMRRTVTAKTVTFTLHPHRKLRVAERRAIDDAADRYGDYLGLEPRVIVDAR